MNTRFATGMLLAALISIGVAAQAQLSFTVASIHAHSPADRLTNRFLLGRGGKFTASNCSLRLLIRWAYDILPSQVMSAPNWVGSAGWDIAAEGDSDAQVREIQTMFQQLLEDRFQFQYHWETKEALVYELVVSKTGKLRENTVPGDCPSIFSPEPTASTGTFAGALCGELPNFPGHAQGNKLTGAELAGSLSYFLDRPVLDKTGLKGKYDIELRWMPERDFLQSSVPPETSAPSIFTALQEQLGLKLESAKGPVKFLVIDHVERASDN